MSEKVPIDSRALETAFREKMTLETPNHPTTGEQGVFSRFLDGVPRPVYVAVNGGEFLHPDGDWDERLREAGAETVAINDNGFFATGDESLLPPLE